MANVKISQLPSLTTMTDAAEIPVVAGGVTYQITGANLTNYFTGIYGNTNVVANLAALGTNPISTTGNITGGNLSAVNLVINNIRSDDSSFVNIEDGVNITGAVVASGNITGGYILGNGSQLTGLPATYGNANVVANLAALGSNPVSTTGNVTGGNLTTAGIANIASLAVTGSATVQGSISIFSTSTSLSATGNVIVGNVLTGGLISATGNVTAGNLDAVNLVINSISSDDSSFVTIEDGVNVNGTISATGNISGNYFIGNGSLLTGMSNTGNVTFSGETVIGTGTSNLISGLYLAPSSSSANASMYLRVRGNINDEPTHIHFDTGNNAYYNQFIGDDNKYIQLANTGNIIINSNDGVGNSAQWIFDAAGKITLPNGASLNDTSGDSVAFGQNAGLTSQAQHAVAIGINAGREYQGEDSIAIGYNAGYRDQGRGVAIGWNAGQGGTLFKSVSDAQGGSGPVHNYVSGNGNPTLTLDSVVSVNVNDKVFGNNIPGGAFVASINAPDINISAPPTAALTAGDDITFVSLTLGLNNASNIVVGMRATGTDIPANTFVQNTGCSIVEFNQYPTAPLTDGASIVFSVGQGFGATAVGYQSGSTFQGDDAVAVGRQAGYSSQNDKTVAVGGYAGYNIQGANAVAVGYNAGQGTQGINAVAVGYKAGQNTQGARAVAIGEDAGYNTQGANTVAIGAQAGAESQGIDAVAIGAYAGNTSQGNAAVAVGRNAGNTSQGLSSIAIGENAGYTNQANNSIILNATGANLNQTTANTFTVAPVRNDVANTANVMFYNVTSKEITYGNTINVAGNITGGNLLAVNLVINNIRSDDSSFVNIEDGVNITGAVVASGNVTSGNISTGVITLTNSAVIKDTTANAVAFGREAGATTQKNFAVAVGWWAGKTTQGNNSVAVGPGAGYDTQGRYSVAVGDTAGGVTQSDQAIAIGTSAGQTTQGFSAIAIGSAAGFNLQSANAVAIGFYAGNTGQGNAAVAVGYFAGATTQGNTAVAIGSTAGQTNQGINAVAIGTSAGLTNQGNNSIILNATGSALDQTTANTFTVAPVRNDVANIGNVMFYNATSKEITYGNVISVAGNITGGNLSAVNLVINSIRSDDSSFVNIEDGVNITGAVVASDNITGGNILTGGLISATGNISGGNISTGIIRLTNGADIKDTANNAVAFGKQAGATSQGSHAVAIGRGAGLQGQGTYSVAIGYLAGNNTQGGDSVAVGVNSGGQLQGAEAVAVGSYAGYTSQGNLSVAVGRGAGENSQGANSVAVGTLAGRTSQANNSIILNATGANLEQTTANTFTVKPVRGDSTANLVGGGFKAVYYNSTTGEFAYTTD